MVGGYTYLNPSAVGLAGAGVHGPIPNTAHNQANLWTSYDFGSGLELGTGVNYISERFAGTDTLLIPGAVGVPTVPGYATWDAMIGYRFNRSITLQLNGLNLTDKYYFMNSYFTRPYENHTAPGPGRTMLLTVRLSL
mgnify:FL=1